MTTIVGEKAQQKHYESYIKWTSKFKEKIRLNTSTISVWVIANSYIQWFKLIKETRPWLNQETKINVHNRTVLPVSDR